MAQFNHLPVANEHAAKKNPCRKNGVRDIEFYAIYWIYNNDEK